MEMSDASVVEPDATPAPDPAPADMMIDLNDDDDDGIVNSQDNCPTVAISRQS